MARKKNMWDLFQKHFEFVERMMEETMKELFEEFEEVERIKGSKVKPKVYGIRINVGPDGKVDVEEFGDVKQTIEALGEGDEEKIGAREPLTEVHEEGDDMLVVAELPGIEEKDLSVKLLDDKTLEIKVDGERKYYKKVSLPHAGKEIEQTYKNGILQVRVKKK